MSEQAEVLWQTSWMNMACFHLWGVSNLQSPSFSPQPDQQKQNKEEFMLDLMAVCIVVGFREDLGTLVFGEAEREQLQARWGVNLEGHVTCLEARLNRWSVWSQDTNTFHWSAGEWLQDKKNFTEVVLVRKTPKNPFRMFYPKVISRLYLMSHLKAQSVERWSLSPG